jgi:ubiquinone/menaquinone biosynthesis C-methylase UbiE
MDEVLQTVRTYDRIAPEYCEKTREPRFLEWEEGYIKKLMGYISSPAPIILNVGCGDGRDNVHIEMNGARAIGIDLSEGMLREAKKYYPVGDFRKMDMRDLAFEDDFFDGIWASGSIYHVPKSEVKKIIGEFERVLKNDGVLSLNFKLGKGEGLEANPKSYDGSPRYFAYYTKQEMKNIMVDFGFKEIESCLYPEEIFNDKIQQMWFRLEKKSKSQR